MANASIAQSVNRTTVAAALQAARTEAAEHRAWINAINRAALNLESCPWQFDGEILVIASATSASRYTVDAHGCACKAGQAGRPCWHRAARRLLVKASELAYTASSTNGYQDAPLHPFDDGKPSMGEMQAAVDELFA